MIWVIWLYATGGVPMPGETVWVGGGAGTANLVQKGSLTFQMLARATHSVVWTGTAAGTLKESRVEKFEQLNNALSKIFEKYPPGKKK